LAQSRLNQVERCFSMVGCYTRQVLLIACISMTIDIHSLIN